mmetsp:Transcript_43269/g.114439  ORF Transcript_43269/g.114439 Transcript_43269/m.114439 type:complete len:86 (+) Transcript_43269:3-260(+)
MLSALYYKIGLGAGPPAPSSLSPFLCSGAVLLEVLYGFLHGADAVSIVIRDDVAKLVLDLQEDLYLVEIIEAQIIPLRRGCDVRL